PEAGPVAGWAAIGGGAVQVAVAGLEEFAGVLASVAAGERVERGEGAARGDLEHGAVIARPAYAGRAVQVAVAGLEEFADGLASVAAVGSERVEGGEGGGGGELERGAVSARPPGSGGAV